MATAIEGELACAQAHFERLSAEQERRRRRLEDVYVRAWRDGWNAGREGYPDDGLIPIPADLLTDEDEHEDLRALRRFARSGGNSG